MATDRFSPNYNPGKGAQNPSIQQIRGGMSSTSTISAQGKEQPTNDNKPKSLGESVSAEQNRLNSAYGGYIARDQGLQRENIARNIVETGSPISPSSRILTAPEKYQSYSGHRPGLGDPVGIRGGESVPGYAERNIASNVHYPVAFGGGEYGMRQQEAVNRGYTGYMKTDYGGGMGGENIPGTQSIVQSGGEKLFNRIGIRLGQQSGAVGGEFSGAKEGLKMFGLDKVKSVQEGGLVTINVGDKSFSTAESANTYLRQQNLNFASNYRAEEAASYRAGGLYDIQDKIYAEQKLNGPIFTADTGLGQSINVSSNPLIMNLAAPLTSAAGNIKAQDSVTGSAAIDSAIRYVGSINLPFSSILVGRDINLGTATKQESIAYGINIGSFIGGAGEALQGARTAAQVGIQAGKFTASYAAGLAGGRLAGAITPSTGVFGTEIVNIEGIGVTPKTLIEMGAATVTGGAVYGGLGGSIKTAAPRYNPTSAYTSNVGEAKLPFEVSPQMGRETFEITDNNIAPKPIQINAAKSINIYGEGEYTGFARTAGTADFPLKTSGYLPKSGAITESPVVESFQQYSPLKTSGTSSPIKGEFKIASSVSSSPGFGKGLGSGINGGKGLDISGGTPIVKNVFTSESTTLSDTYTKFQYNAAENMGVESVISARNILSPGQSVGKPIYGTANMEALDYLTAKTGVKVGGREAFNIQGSGSILSNKNLGYISASDVNAGSQFRIGGFNDVTSIKPEISPGRYSATRMGSGKIGIFDETLATIKYSESLNVFPEQTSTKGFKINPSEIGGRAKTSLNTIYKANIENVQINRDFSSYVKPVESGGAVVRGYRVTDYQSMPAYREGIGFTQSSSTRYASNLGGKAFETNANIIGNFKYSSIGKFNNPMLSPSKVSNQGLNKILTVGRSDFKIGSTFKNLNFNLGKNQYNPVIPQIQSPKSQFTSLRRQISVQTPKLGQISASLTITNPTPNINLPPVSPNNQGPQFNFPFSFSQGGAFIPFGSPPGGGGGSSRGRKGFNSNWWKNINPFITNKQALKGLKFNIPGF
jgi:hypothetical protein